MAERLPCLRVGMEARRAQVERGMAWAYTKCNKDVPLPVLQGQARAERRGLGFDPEPIQPRNP